jgi:hypothetical protein
MRAHGDASIGALLGLLIAACGACAEQHHGDSSEPGRIGDDARGGSPGSSDATPPNSRATQTTAGTTNPAGMAATPPSTSATMPSAMAQTSPVPGAMASTTPIPFPDPEPFDPMRTGCGSPRASEGVWLVVSSPSQACNVDEDCFVAAGAVSCSSECARGSLNVAERANVERLFPVVEDKYCTPYRKAGCPVLAPAGCSSDESLPRCVEHYCSAVPQRCEAGCKPDSPGGTCRGAERCDGCPSVIIEADGKPCSKPGQSCTLDASCSPNVRCKDEKEPGVFRWVLFVPLC